MWNHDYTPLAGSLGMSAIVAGLPVFVLLYLLGVRRKPAWVASLFGLVAASAVGLAADGMPPSTVTSAAVYGARFALFPIGCVVFCSTLGAGEGGEHALPAQEGGH